jgi:eight-cysteine-cluster-containing protein
MKYALLSIAIVFGCGGPQASSGGGGGAGSGSGEPAPSACVKDGCSGTVCRDASAEPVMTTCEYQAAYACYATATCEPQADGACGWTPTTELTECLASPPPLGGETDGAAS